MIISLLKLDIDRYITTFNDRVVTQTITGDLSVCITEYGNTLICKKEKYISNVKEDLDNGQMFDMIKYVIFKNRRIMSGEELGCILRKGNINLINRYRKLIIGE